MTTPEPSQPRPEHSPSLPLESVLADIERAMSAIRRSMSRRALGRKMAEQLGEAVDLTTVAVVDAVEQGGKDSEGVTVGDVAERLAIDPSRGSRVVSAAIEAGYLRRQASQTDGRRICLELTDRGRELAESARRVRRQAFEAAMRDWSAEERETFARLLTRFVEAQSRPAR